MTATVARPAIDDWPGLAPVPSGLRTAVSEAVARRMFVSAVRRLPVTVDLDGAMLGTGGPAMTIRRPDEFFARLGRGGLIGFGESYLTRAWDAEDLGAFLTVLAAHLPQLVPAGVEQLRNLVLRRPPKSERSSRAHSRHNIAHHYDLSNELFQQFLDPSLTYSSALFPAEELPLGDAWSRMTAPAPGGDLADGQSRKIDRLLDRTGVTEGTRVLEIGTGWGELAIRAARRGAEVHSITLSTAQQELAEDRVAAAGQSDRVDVGLLDYRALPTHTTYDVVLSVEMIEAVGHRYWDEYFAILDAMTAPGGRVGLQAITMPHDRMLATRNTYTWINKYVFPGGLIPSVEAIEDSTRRSTTLRVRERLAFGTHYAETLRQWDQRFLSAPEAVLALGFDETFLRMWHFYLEYARAGFVAGYLDVNQVVLAREGSR